MNEDALARRQEFIRQFELQEQAGLLAEPDEEEVEVRSQQRSSLIFWLVIGALAVCPFILSGFLLYTIARYDQLIGTGGLDMLSETLSSADLDAMAKDTGVPELEFFVSLNENKYLIMGATFTFFFLTIALLILLRSLFFYLRNRKHG